SGSDAALWHLQQELPGRDRRTALSDRDEGDLRQTQADHRTSLWPVQGDPGFALCSVKGQTLHGNYSSAYVCCPRPDTAARSPGLDRSIGPGVPETDGSEDSADWLGTWCKKHKLLRYGIPRLRTV